MGEYGGGGHPLHAEVLGQCATEEDEEVLFHGVLQAVVLVVLVQAVQFVTFVPVLVTAVQQRQALGVETGVVYGRLIIDGQHGGGQEAPVSVDILQTLPLVGAGNEGGVAHEAERLGVVHLSLQHAVLCHDALQSNSLPHQLQIFLMSMLLLILISFYFSIISVKPRKTM